MPAAAWRRPVDGWSLDGIEVALAQQPLRVVVGMLLADSPIPMILGTTEDPAVSDVIAKMIVDIDGGITDELLELIADGIAEAYFARPRWQAAVLWRRAIEAWPDIDGELTGRGVDIMELPPDRATNVVFHLLMARVAEDKNARAALVSELQAAPAAVQTRSMKRAKDAERQQADWDAVAALAAAAQGT
ncbi:hypothetical protein CH302_19290 [Rhodococcus sp. 15-2388-1-1a]|uniref:hypothetical protein n=1 Tax=Nocardiaceae TaxID=85025 RepID=UPI000569DBB4|nr:MULTISPECIES: hypothetical protein [Rhodococcus]OZE95086.1 hypothetical protein CH302_19290 [Rhodococcus sp. 15-2388-1-1a]